MIKILKSIRMIFIRCLYHNTLTAGKGFTCGRGTILFAKNHIKIGDNVYIGKYCTIECDAEIGNDVLIANNVGLIGRLDHDYKTIGVPVRFAPAIRDKGYEMPASKGKIVIGDDVWISYGSILLSGITIGDGAIIAAGSLVTKDVEPFTVVAGVPAKTISIRFSKEDIKMHKELCRKNFSSYRDNIDFKK